METNTLKIYEKLNKLLKLPSAFSNMIMIGWSSKRTEKQSL